MLPLQFCYEIKAVNEYLTEFSLTKLTLNLNIEIGRKDVAMESHLEASTEFFVVTYKILHLIWSMYRQPMYTQVVWHQ